MSDRTVDKAVPPDTTGRPGSRAAMTLILILVAILFGTGATLSGATPERIQDLQARLEGILRDTGWRSSEYSILAVSLDTGDTLFARAPDTTLAPASNMKLLTSAAALAYLGPDFRYRTFVLADGRVESGRLEGDLVLYGTGDPGISDRFYDTRTAVFEELADDLLAQGIHQVTGDVVGDGSYFVGPELGPRWDPRDLNDWFAAPVGALTYNENVVTLRVEPGSRNGVPPRIRTLPEDAGVPIRNDATTGRGRLRIDREDPGQPIRVDGAVPRGGNEVWRRMTVGDPARFAARAFRNVVEDKGIRVAGEVRTIREPSASPVTGHTLWVPARQPTPPRILAVHESPPLETYLEVVNKKSHNLLAELTFKTMGRIRYGDGSFEGGTRAVKRFLAQRADVDTTGLVILDGSGLSSENRVSSGTLISLLAHMAGTDLWDAWWRTLPEAGNPRELRRMYRTAAAGNLRAKTGTIEHVSALSGVVHSANGERIAFSIIGNDVPSTWAAKRVEDRIGVQLASFQRPFEERNVRLAATGPEAGAERAGTADGSTSEASTSEGRTEALQSHVVQRGENFTVIAHEYGVSLEELMDANPDVRPGRLMPGQALTIPGPSGGQH